MTSRQFYVILCVFIISLKVQKMPALVSSVLGTHSYVLFLLYFLVDIIGVLLAFFVLKVLKRHDFLKVKRGKFITLFINIGLIFISIYFILQATLFYESIQDLFSHVLFDNLPWTVFSLLLVACVFYLAASGISNLARNFELYFFIIAISYLGLAIFGGISTDFTVVLPFQEISLTKIFGQFVNFNIWFGDFFLVLFLGINAKDIKLKWTLLVYFLSAIFVVLLLIEFEGIYLNYAGMQPNLISMISEQTMLGLDIGRVDWFLILITEVGAILSCGVCLHFAKNCISIVIPKVKSNYILFALVAALYLLDVIYLVDLNAKKTLFLSFGAILALGVKLGSFFVLIILSIKWKIKKRKSIPSTNKFKDKQSLNVADNSGENYEIKS